MTLKAKILKRVAWDEEKANAKGYEHSEEAWQYFSEGARWQLEQIAPLLEALVETATVLLETHYCPITQSRKPSIKCSCERCKALSNLERLLSSETKERDE